MSLDRKAAFLGAVRQGAGDFAPRGLEYVYHQVIRLARQGSGYRQVPALEFCRVFQELAAADFGRLAPHVLETWGLRSGEALGRAIFLLADWKCLSVKHGETLEEYAAAGSFRFP